MNSRTFFKFVPDSRRLLSMKAMLLYEIVDVTMISTSVHALMVHLQFHTEQEQRNCPFHLIAARGNLTDSVLNK